MDIAKMDKIFIEQLEVMTIIGVYEREQKIKQVLWLDIELFCDIKLAAETDKLEHALDYAAVATHIEEYLENNHFQLIETAAEKIAQLILATFKVSSLRLKLSKPSALQNASTVSVFIERS